MWKLIGKDSKNNALIERNHSFKINSTKDRDVNTAMLPLHVFQSDPTMLDLMSICSYPCLSSPASLGV